MFICKICDYKCKRGSGHIKAKHGISSLEYLKEHEDISVIVLYQQGFSAQQICSTIRQKMVGLNPIKKDILVYLKNNGVEIRNTSEATKCWIDKSGGVWNKGLTKQDHQSIMRYSESRAGENNPYYTSAEESREKTKWWKYKTNFEVNQIRKKAGDTLKKRYKDGRSTPYSIKNPQWGKENLIKLQEGFARWLQNGNKNKFGNPSLAEREISSILEELNVRYTKQATVGGKYSCDLLLPDYSTIIEYYGTYWHCDPRKYNKDYYNQKKNKTAQEIWDYDFQREATIRQEGYKVIIIWEADYKLLESTQKRKMIYEALESKNSNKTSQG